MADRYVILLLPAQLTFICGAACFNRLRYLHGEHIMTRSFQVSMETMNLLDKLPIRRVFCTHGCSDAFCLTTGNTTKFERPFRLKHKISVVFVLSNGFISSTGFIKGIVLCTLTSR